ncbi:PEP-CTERM putative exosortase interaction domain-containing protein [Desulfocapsa sulfexigens DSM 10523]|uniref:PEP-CTERM putative exosortase interaction domain-containing protein n=1 Tax=Desulfocapsa sulfexigens (strain DSM 10523 / SB164P1) TaxID=1167006 RepID=M1ND61_DESSD|nr:PEP-CTERM sorting domain-containing protein [Desulfocapsa sulfexigens]AGF77699.1 PEP-CTERM putative exosortase interaction domain-containing protein [Desulfocapsa sulfexigens DSM 10523]
MRKSNKITSMCFAAAFVCLFFLGGSGVSQATLVVAGAGQYPLIGTGSGGGDGLDDFDNVNWLLDEYYERDVDVFSIGKFEEEYIGDEPQGNLIPVGFTAPWDPAWFSWDGNILDTTDGVGYINIPSDSIFNWTGHFWYSIKAGSAFGLYDGGILTLTAGSSYSIPWDIKNVPAGFTGNGLSHFSLWAEEASPVPEPATILLFGAGLVGIAGIRLRKTK